MALRALEWLAGSAGPPTTRTDFEPGALSQPGRGASAGLPVAYVLPAESLAAVWSAGRAVIDCGVKRPNRALSALALGRTRVPVITAGFTHAGQAARSVKTLLANAVRSGDRNAYVVGIPAELFSELWVQHHDGGPNRTVVDPGGRLLQLLPPRAVPKALAGRYVGESSEAELVRQLILRAAERDDPMLVSGEAGTGKELVARAIHEYSRRRSGPFATVNCGAIPHDLFESELFGHERGAVPGSRRKKVGFWQVASRGTLFLDDVGRLPPRLQARILAALRDRVILPVGADDEVRVDTRVIAAAHGDLFLLVENRQFRDDLYYSLRSLHIQLPVLREHPEDVTALARHFWRTLTGDAAAEVPGQVLEELRSYRWPGNARELRAALSSLLSLFGSKSLTREHVRAAFALDGRAGRVAAGRGGSSGRDTHRLECIRHLRAAAEAIRAVGVTLRPLTGGRRLDRPALRALAQSVGHRLEEIDALARRPALFHGDVTLDLVGRLFDRLIDVRRKLEKEMPEARACWRREGVTDLTLATRAILAELRGLQGTA